MSARFEICRTPAGWHARFRAANGRIVFSSEVYTRRHNALKALLSIADAFWDDGFVNARLARDEIDALFLTNHDTDYVEVREIDERGKP